MLAKGYEWLTAFTALCSFFNGLAYLFFPISSLVLLGGYPDEFGLTITRYYGACAIGWGLLLWLARKSSDFAMIRAVLASILVTLGISALAGAWGMAVGIFNGLGWSLVVTDSILSLLALLILWKLREDPAVL